MAQNMFLFSRHSSDSDDKLKLFWFCRNMKINETLRPHLSITLSHAEKRDVAQESLCQRIREVCTVIAKEKHQENGFHHYHAAVKAKNASKNNATRIIREVFPEFEGKQCDVRFPKGWAGAYITKEDREPLVWGESSRDKIIDIAENARKHRKNTTVPAESIIRNLEECDDWYAVYENPILRDRLKYSDRSLRREDIETIKQIHSRGKKVIIIMMMIISILISFLMASQTVYAMEHNPPFNLDLTLRLGQPGQAQGQGAPLEMVGGEDNPLVDQIKKRFYIYSPDKDVYTEDVETLISLKREIIARMAELDPHPFWLEQENRIIGESILNPKGPEYLLTTLEKKKDQLFRENPTATPFYFEMIRIKRHFFLTGRF